jgi:hypothetical protein
MSEEFHKPTMFPGMKFEAFRGGDDPAQLSKAAHESANALVARVRKDPTPEIIDRLTAYTAQNGIDALAELWSRASPRSLPGALWRVYLLQFLIRQDSLNASFFFQRGYEVATTIDPVVAGAPEQASPSEIVVFADQILRGVFSGDFAVALERVAAFCRLSAAGAASVADDCDVTAPERSRELTVRALRFTEIAADLVACARLWRQDSLE